MNIVDIIIILLFITALLRGIEIGIIRQACSTIGLLIGLVSGIFIQGLLIGKVHTPDSKALLALLIIVSTVGFFIGVSGTIGEIIRRGIERAKRMQLLDRIDRGFGAIVAGATLLLAVWLGASLFNNVPLRDLQRQVRNSVVIAQLNKHLPPVPGAVAQIGHLINPNTFPDVFTGLEPRVDTTTPLPSLGDLNAAVTASRKSVVKVEGAGCGGISQGTGFIASQGLVVTNAHVVAGVARPYIIDGAGQHAASVISFDPDLDIAVLRTTNLEGDPLPILTARSENGTPSVVLGYPGGGGFTAHAAVTLESFHATGHNIYNQGETDRQVYSIKADVKPGNSGGPLVNEKGEVIGVVFAESTTYENMGYALQMQAVQQELSASQSRTAAVGTGSCTE